MKDKLAYLGSPYTKYKAGLPRAFTDVAELCARLVGRGLHIFSPIVHAHPIAMHGGLDPLDLTIWYPWCRVMMDRSDILIVAHMEGWQESAGLRFEVDHFERAHKPIYDLNPATLTMTKRGIAA